MKSLFLIMLLALGFTVFAQKRISYEYDNAGNRKATIVLKSATIPKDTVTTTAQQATPAPQPVVPGVVASVTAPDEQVSFNETLGRQEIKIFPNPTRGELKVTISSLEAGSPARLLVYNSAGSLVVQNESLSTSNEINLSGQRAGMYILRIVLGTKTSEWKVIKQ